MKDVGGTIMIRADVSNIHWPYYLAFECDVESLARYIEFKESNYCTHSIELARLLLAASSEADVLLKEVCKLIDPSQRPQNIDQYKDIIRNDGGEWWNIRVESRRYGLQLNPWSNWAGGDNPDWWWAYNKVKHERSNHFQQANLKNTLNSVAALLVLNIEYAFRLLQSDNSGYPYELKHAIGSLYPASELFRISDPWAYYVD